MDTKDQATTASWINVIAGVWLIIAPFVLHYTNNIPRTNDIWLGVIVALLALIRAFTPIRTMWLSWVNIVAGLWLIVSPFVLGYANTTPRWNDVLLGIIVAGLAIWSASAAETHRTGHFGT